MASTAAQLVIFGASGDLTARKLIPALLGAWRSGVLPGELEIIGVSRTPKADAAWRDELRGWLSPEEAEGWADFAPRLRYVAADAATDAGLARVQDALDPARGWLFYLSLKPALFAPVIARLSAAGMLRCAPGDGPWRRVVIEKPFGHDLESAQALNRDLLTWLREDQLFRIDHYLGKETVQNILALRFQNAIFEPLWSRVHIESVELSVCEDVAVEGGRGDYYDAAGALRDMVQNHLLQVLSLVAMEAPASMAAEAVRDEKVKVLRALSRMTPAQVHRDVVRGQYVGYHDERGVAPGSVTETFVALRASIHSWRWSGVPFLLRTGKAMHRKYTEVILRFRTPPVDLLGGPTDGEACALRPNALHLLIQPREQIRLSFLVKQPGHGVLMRPAQLRFDYQDIQDTPSPPAYQRLLVDALRGDATLFLRSDEVEAAWRFVDAVAAGWADPDAPPPLPYAPGSTGPDAADDLFRGCEGVWGQGQEDAP